MFVPEYNTWGGGRVEQRIHPPRKRVAWKKLRKERKKFSKLLIFRILAQIVASRWGYNL
jgi:hypothetical protein